MLWPLDQPAARVHWEHAVEMYRRVGDTRMLAYALPKAAIGYLGDPDRTTWRCELCDEGVELSRQIGDRPLIAPALNVRGELTRIAGRDDLARAAYEEGRDLSIAAGDDAHLSVFLANLSYIAEHEGDYDESRRLACESLRLLVTGPAPDERLDRRQARRIASCGWAAGARRPPDRRRRPGPAPPRRRPPSGRHARARAGGGGAPGEPGRPTVRGVCAPMVPG